jgi:hypothetical protein
MVHPSQGTPREEVFWSLAVLVVVLLVRRLLMRVFFVGLRSLVYPWAETGPLKGPRSRWTGIPRYPEHRHFYVQINGELHIKYDIIFSKIVVVHS